MDTMKVVETAGKVKDFIWTVGLIIVGAAFILFGVLSIKSGIEANSKSYGEAEAVITAIEEELVSEDVDDGATYEYTVLVSYTVNGETYADINLGYYTAGMTEGDKVTVQYDLQDPSQLKSQSAGFMGYIMLIVGLAAVGYGVFRFAKKKPGVEDSEYDRVNRMNVPQETVEAVASCTEEQERFLFHFDQKFKQGYVMKNEQGQLVYEIKMIKLTLFKPFTFDFVNHLTMRTVTRAIGHTVSTSVGTSLFPGLDSEITLSSWFKVDGKKNWDYLAENGYSFEVSRAGMSFCYSVKKYGVPVAFLKTVGTNAMTGKDLAVGKLPVNGIYEVNCRRSDLDMIAMVCMSIARTLNAAD